MSSYDSPQANADLVYRLRTLSMAGSVLHLGAHPDDEDSGTIAYLSRGLGIRTVYWSATRGEGGQNRQGPEEGEALGIVRTWESLEARQVDGGEVLYGPFYDFGFSKSGERALAKWGRDDVVRELVRAIRMVQPQVVISRWSGGPQDGHGHHQAIGLLAQEAFEAGGDAARFPELLESGLVPWQARKLYHSLAGDWQPGEDLVPGKPVPEYDRPGVLPVNTGAFDPVSGRTFQELASIGRNRHRTQAMAELPERGDFVSYYQLDRTLVAVQPRERGFFDGLDPTLTGLADYPGGGSQDLRSSLAEVQKWGQAASSAFRPEDPVEAGEAALQGLDLLNEVRRTLGKGTLDDSRSALQASLARKARMFEETIGKCFGVSPECLVPRRAVPGEHIRVTARVWCLGTGRIDGADMHLRLPEGWTAHTIDASGSLIEARGERLVQTDFDVAVPATAAFSCPYWLRDRRDPYRYRWPESGPCGLPFDDAVVSATFDIAIGTHRFSLSVPGLNRETFAGGFRELPLVVLPAMALQPKQQRVILSPKDEPQKVELQVSVRATSETGGRGELALEIPTGWGVRPSRVEIALAGGGESRSLQFELTVPGGTRPGVYEATFGITSGDHTHGVMLRPVWRGAPGVPRPADETNSVAEAFVVAPAEVSIHLVKAQFVPTLRYAYIQGTEEEILASLGGFGLDFTLLSDDDLVYADLSAFDTIVVGPNAYLVRNGLRKSASRLLEYVHRGGTLIVQYQGYGYQAEGLAPYSFRYHQPHDRVTFPDAGVTVLQPDHPILHLPNQITADDFEGWVHDRALYCFGDWSRSYVPLLECHDPGEDPQSGGLLVASYGRGVFVYTAYSFFRQIPVGYPVPSGCSQTCSDWPKPTSSTGWRGRGRWTCSRS